jgi:hypothetical protein
MERVLNSPCDMCPCHAWLLALEVRMNNNQWQQKGYYWKKQQEEKKRQREAFNREQMEEEARAQEQVDQPPEPAAVTPGGSGWSGSNVTTEAAVQPRSRMTFGRVLLILMMLAGGFLLLTTNSGPTEWLIVGGLVAALFFWQRALGRRATRPGRRRRGIVGEARAVQRRMEDAGSCNVEVLSFRIERYDENGNRLPPVPVQIKGASFVGTIQEGDQVQLKERWKPGRIVQVKRIQNLTTQNTVTAKGQGVGPWMGLILFVLFVACVVAFFIAASNGGF